jgi:reactive intermediate/imine deaminase
MELVGPDIEQQINQVFDNLSAIAAAAGTTLNETVKFTVYLTNLGHFSIVNEVMTQRLIQPYPARVALEVSALPRSALVEIDAIVAIT